MPEGGKTVRLGVTNSVYRVYICLQFYWLLNSEHIKNNLAVYFKWVNFIVYEIEFNKAVKLGITSTTL